MMKIIIQAKTNSKENRVEKIDEHNYIVFVKESPVAGKANAQILKTLAEYFDMAPSLIEITAGYFSKRKIVEVYRPVAK